MDDEDPGPSQPQPSATPSAMLSATPSATPSATAPAPCTLGSPACVAPDAQEEPAERNETSEGPLGKELSWTSSQRRRHKEIQGLRSLSSISVTAEQDQTVYAIPAFSALRLGGYCFRKSVGGNHHRRAVPQIDEFWSYSRHGLLHQHVCSLLLYYNGWPAILAGCLAVAVCLLLPWHELVAHHQLAGIIVMWIAVCASSAVMLMWPSQRKVFLDAACISQEDADMKGTGILSLGYYLKESQKLLILWDPTYFSRLWCVFEVAAYLKLRKEGTETKPVSVRPAVHSMLALWWFCGIAWFITIARALSTIGDQPVTLTKPVGQLVSSIACVVIVVRIRPQVVSFGALQQQLANFSLRDAKSFCCDVNHVDPVSKQRIDCDRKLIESCVVEWFGQVEAFDAVARQELHKHVDVKLRLPFVYMVWISLPFFVEGLGAAVWMAQSGDTLAAWTNVLDRAAGAFLVVPLVIDVVTASAAIAPQRSMAWGVLAGLGAFNVVTSIYWFAPYIFGLPGYAVVAGSLGALLLLSRTSEKLSALWPSKARRASPAS